MKKHEEMLVITMEECGELVQACSKLIRSKNKAKYLKWMREEVGDVVTMIEIIKESGLVTEEEIQKRVHEKRKKLEKWSNIFKE
jgi:NTP pyrophosphatase (non-canonical NTP hydrolase)